MLSEAAGSSQEDDKESRSDSNNSADPDALNHSVSLEGDCDTDDIND